MRILDLSSEIERPAGLLWREQVQVRAAELVRAGTRWRDPGGPTWQAEKKRKRAFIRHALAPIRATPPVPLRARTIGGQNYDAFRVERVVFEAMPDWIVGLTLFLPVGTGPFRPVLCPCGHSDKSFDSHQLPPQVFARSGFAAALFDMPSFGERWKENDHFVQGAQTLLAGVWSNLFFLIDCIRAGDYLQTRPDIDFSRGMAVTGVSGGGFATMYMAHLDDRVSVIAPVCSLDPLMGHVAGGLYTACPENYMEGAAAAGLDFPDTIAVASPLPCLVMAGTRDELFHRMDVEQAFEGIRAAYEAEHVANRVRLFFDDCPHAYTLPMANEAAQWIGRWLDRTDPFEPVGSVDLLPARDLDCATGETTGTMWGFVKTECSRLRAARAQGNAAPSGADFPEQKLRRLLKLPSDPSPDRIQAVPAPLRWGRQGLQRWILHSDDLPVPLLTLSGAGDDPHDVLLVTDGGKHAALRAFATPPTFERLFAADIRGFGELEPEPTDYDTHPWCSVDRALWDLLFLCGRTALGEQTRDVLRATDFVRAQGAGPERLILYGQGEAALPVLFASLLCPEVQRVCLHGFLCSFSALVKVQSPLWKRYSFLPHVLKHFDIPELLAGVDSKRFLLINPLDGAKRSLDEKTARRLYGEDGEHLKIVVGDANPLQTLKDWFSFDVRC